MTTRKFSKLNTFGIMDGGPIWTPVNYTAETEYGTVKAVIPQKCLRKDGTIYPAIVGLLREPNDKNRKKLFIAYGVTTHVISKEPVSPVKTFALPIAA